MNKKYLSLFIAVFILAIFGGIVENSHADTISSLPQWRASGTVITPSNPSSTLYVPSFGSGTDCLHTVSGTISATTGDCGSGGSGSSTSSPNLFTVTGNTTTTLSGNATTSSYIPYDNNVQYLNPGYATVGAAGSSTATTFQAAINAIALQSQANGQPGVTINVNFNIPSSTFTGTLNLNENGFIVSLDCSAGVEIGYSGTGTAIDWNNGNPTGHLASDDHGCIYMGHNTLIAAGQTNTATTTGIMFGGNQGAVGIDFHDNSINGFGTDLDVATNTYMLKVQNNSISGGNGGQAGEIASLIQVNKASNSGEGIDLEGNNLADPGNSSSSNCIVFQDSSLSNAELDGGEVDDCGVYNGFSNGALLITGVHFEDSDFSAYMPYTYIYGTSSQASYMNISGNLFEIDDTNSATIPAQLINHGQQVYASGNVIQNYGGQTIPLFINHNLNNGTEVETVCGTGFFNGTLTNLMDNLTFAQSGNGQGCWTDISNSFPIGMSQTSGNTASIYNGGQAVATFSSNGNWNIGSSVNNSTVTTNNNLSVPGTLVVTGISKLASTTITQATTTALAITSLGGTGTPCLDISNSAGNVATTTCGGAGGGGVATSSPVSSGTLVMFTGGAPTLTNSLLSQSGSTVTANGILNASTSYYLGGTLFGAAFNESTTAGYGTTVLGHLAGQNDANNSSTIANTYVGYYAGEDNGTGTQDTYIGSGAGYGNDGAGGSTASFATCVGQESCYNVTSAGGVTAIGQGAALKLTSGGEDSAGGLDSQFNDLTGSNNTSWGWESLYDVTSTNGSTAVGSLAGNNDTGDHNTFVGEYAGNETGQATTTSYCNVLGAQSWCTKSDQTVLGTPAVTTETDIYGTTIIESNTLTDASGNEYVTSTSATSGSGNLFVTPTSSVLANNVVAFKTSASSTVDATTSIYTFPQGDTSIGSSTDNGLFSVVNASNTAALQVASTTNNSNALTVAGHMGFATSSVSVSSCGTGSPTIKGSDNAGAIVTGSSASSCTLNFAKNWVNNPVCVESDSNTTAVTDVSAITTSSVTFSMASALSAVNIYYICMGSPN